MAYVHTRLKREFTSYDEQLTSQAQAGKPIEHLHTTHPYMALQTIWLDTRKELLDNPLQSAYQTFLRHQERYNDRLALHNNAQVQEALRELETNPSRSTNKEIINPYYRRAGVDFQTNQPRYESQINDFEELLRLMGRTASF